MKSVFVIVTAIGMILPAAQALADCNPPCPSGQTCRYEAAGGKFYCAATQGVKGGNSPGGVKTPGGKAPSRVQTK
ncbi:MAG: hypothetical protein AB7O88_26225 [Reyranellaceae bacterium]